MFHTFVAKELFATKISRPGIHTAVAFLTTHVCGPNMIQDFREHDPSPDKKANTPAAEFLFKVDDELRMVDDSRAKVFHTFVAKSLLATKRSRTDIHTAVAF